MRILHVIETMSLRFGGPVTVLKSLAHEQVRRGHDVSILTTNVDYPNGTLPVPVGRPVIEDGVRVTYHPVQFRPLKFSMSMAAATMAAIDAHDLAHIHGLYRLPTSLAARTARRCAKPYVMMPHGALDPFMYAQSSKSVALKRLYERVIDFPNLRAANAIHFTTREEQELASHLNLGTPGFVVPIGLDWEPFATLPAPGSFRGRIGVGAEVPLVLFLGRVNFKKGLDLLVPAFAQIRRTHPHAVLAIVGPDNEEFGIRVRAMAAAENLGDSVRFVEMLGPDAVREAYRDSSVFVLPSYSENFGVAVIEALACATPVIISNRVNIHREVANSGSGIVVPCKVGPLAHAIGSLIDDGPRARVMGEHGRTWVRNNYTWPKIVMQMDDEYRKVLSQHSGQMS